MKALMFCLVFAPFIAHAATTGATRPNILLINIDDLGWSDASCMGSKYYETPNIDALAHNGALFTNAYAAAANCAPSRASLLTGQWTPRHRIFTVGTSERGKAADRKLIPTPNNEFLDPQNLTFANILQKTGYRTYSIGKWHVSNDPCLHGFDKNIGGSHIGGPYNGKYTSPFDYKPNATVKEPNIFLTDFLTSEAIKIIKTPSEKPFLIYLPFYAVHSPLEAKKEKVQKYKKKKGNSDHNNPVYAGLIETVDDNIGRLTNALKEQQLDKNTLIILIGDNGGVWEHSKQHPLRAGKGSYYEGGIRDILIMSYPGKISSQKIDTPVTQLDLFPTMLDFSNAGCPKNKILDGTSLCGLLRGEKLEERPLFWHFPIYLESNINCPETRDRLFRTRPGSAIRLGDWKLQEYFEDGAIELFNLKEDISEKNNLAEKYPEKVKELHSILKKWRTDVNAPIPTQLNPKFRK